MLPAGTQYGHVSAAGSAPCLPSQHRAGATVGAVDGGRRGQTVLSHALLPLTGAIVAFPGEPGGTQQQFTTASGRCTHQHAAAAIPLRR